MINNSLNNCLNNCLTNYINHDLDHILKNIDYLWEELRNKKIFITGGTGFFGCWFLESFLWANKKLNLNAQATVLTRNKLKFQNKYPHFFKNYVKNHELMFIDGNIINFECSNYDFDYIIHAATDANSDQSIDTWDTIVNGTQNLLKFALRCKIKSFLLISSGAIYGNQPAEIDNISENHRLELLFNNNSNKYTYAMGKSAAEYLCYVYAKQYNLPIKIARCFAFTGPYLSFNSQFAIGNFIRDGLNGGTIVINGDGSAYRSYLYASDLMIWLWTILFRGQNLRPYNIGSDQAVTIKELANLVSENLPLKPEVKIMQVPKINAIPEKYVPNINRVIDELGLSIKINLDMAIKLTISWYLKLRLN